MGVEGEDAPNVCAGVNFLNRFHHGEKLDLGSDMVVIAAATIKALPISLVDIGPSPGSMPMIVPAAQPSRVATPPSSSRLLPYRRLTADEVARRAGVTRGRAEWAGRLTDRGAQLSRDAERAEGELAHGPPVPRELAAAGGGEDVAHGDALL